MKLVVKVIEGRNIRGIDMNGCSDPYVRLQVGKHKFRTKAVKKCLNPYWGDEFCFGVDDLSGELLINVFHEDKYFNHPLLGTLKIPVSHVFDNSLPATWYSLQLHSKSTKKSMNMDLKHSPQISLLISLPQTSSFLHFSFLSHHSSSPSLTISSSLPSSDSTSSSNLISESPISTATFSSELLHLKTDAHLLNSPSFDQLLKTMDPMAESPPNLSGGLLLDQLYSLPSNHLNTLLFSPHSNFPFALAQAQAKTQLQFGPWKLENSHLNRESTYINPPSKLVKAVKAYEDQTYLKAGSTDFAILLIVTTPDVMYGTTFKIELLFCITPGSELPSGDQSSRLIISWRINFVQSTMMKGMIENGARQALKDSFDLFSNVLAQHVKPVDLKDVGSKKDQALASLQAEPHSDWKLAVQYFANFTAISTILISIYLLLHLWLAAPSIVQGLEFVGLDLPDSIGELIASGVLVLQAKRMFELVARFMQARMQKSTDHGIKAQGDGWLLTIALIEGSNLAAVDSSGFSDPYVVFTCNGKTRTSSIKFQKLDPQWNEIFEFDAMYEPPSVLEVEVFDFDGPFDEATSLGHAEINFLKSNISELADVWIPLQGKLAQACQSKLRLRIFLDNTLGDSAVGEYLAKMEKEVGMKISQRSPQTNTAFQKLFCLPPEEFLINDFTCHLKRKMPLQGRLFLSSRIIGFHASLFGHKTKFFFLWEDIEDIQVASPNLSSMGSPIIIIALRKGKGLDARHGAKTMDEEGRLKFHFHSFVSFSMAQRTIMALWKARSLSPEQKVKIIEEASESSSLQAEESESFVGVEEVSMSEVYVSTPPVPMNLLMEVFGGGEIEKRVMEKTGCLDYSCTPWEVDKGDVYERQICYKSSYKGQVTSTQQKSPLPHKNGCLIEEVLTLHGVPLSDSFNV